MLLSWSVSYEHEHVVHEYTQHWQLHLLRSTCCAGCVVCCRFFLPNPVSILIIKQHRERDGWPVLLGIGHALLLLFFHSSVWLLPLPRNAPPPTGELSSFLFVATKRTCRRHGQSPCWPRMLDQSKHKEKRTQHVSSWQD